MNANSTSTTPLFTGTGIPADAISRRAYELWEQEGKPDGCDLRHWLQAEQELSGARQISTDTPRVSGNGAPRTVRPAPASAPQADVRPLQGTRAGAAARDTKRSPGASAVTEKPMTAVPVSTAGRRK